MIFFCPHCWSEIQEETEICPFCGTHISKESEKSFKDKLISALNHPEPKTRMRAVNILGKLRDRKAAPALTERLEKEKDAFVLSEIILALGMMNDDSLINELSNFNSKDYPIVVRNAAKKVITLQSEKRKSYEAR